MIVRFNLEGDGDAITDRDDAGILTRALQYVWRPSGQRPEQRTRVLVRAVFIPQRTHYSELGKCGLTPKHIDDPTELFLSQSVLGDQCRRNDRIARPGRG